MSFSLSRALGRADEPAPDPAQIDLERALRGGYGPLIRDLATTLDRERAAHEKTRAALAAETRRADTEEFQRYAAEKQAADGAAAYVIEYADGRPWTWHDPQMAPNRARAAAQAGGAQTRVKDRHGRVVWDSINWAATASPRVRF